MLKILQICRRFIQIVKYVTSGKIQKYKKKTKKQKREWLTNSKSNILEIENEHENVILMLRNRSFSFH